LLQMNEPGRALEQFEATLKKEPRRFRSLYGAAHAAQLSGKREASQGYFRELLQVCARADQPMRPELQEGKTALLQK
jgi:Tfp pilus assembly protein PilF